MIDYISNTLRVFYNISSKQVEKAQGGWSAEAYAVTAENGKYFLKVFDKRKFTSKVWIKRIDYYMPIVLELYNNTPFKDELVMPIDTRDGAYKFENADNVFMLYPYIDGYTLADKKLSYTQQQDLALIVSKLHMCAQGLPKKMISDVETFDISFCEKLLSLIETENINANFLKKVWFNYKDAIVRNIDLLKQYARELSEENLDFVLCHTDLHGWNLMQTNKLLLMDWEGLKLAPAEADIFSFTEGYFFDYAYDSFMEVYQHMHPTYSINQKALDFYRIRRRLEDITEFAEGILFNNVSESDTIKSLKYLERECSFLCG